MTKVKIRLVTIDDVKDFVKKTNELGCEADLTLGKYVIDAKSIMGIFSLDLSRELELSVHSDNCNDFMNEISRYIVN
ncbi:MAG: HPr family phosphocarrier protein [Ruminiclostridium sp.]|nr:HPr family phosphocarrier protein [Ruminiclostridium sp.]